MGVNLKQFCGTDKYRPYLHNPFSIGEWTYATNGHILVRIPRDASAPEPTEPALNSSAPKHFNGPAPTLSLPIAELGTVECPICEGSGKEHACPLCSCPCPNCTGTARVVGGSAGLHGVPFNARYILMLQALPGARIAQPEPGAPLRFSFDGGEGVLMPLSGPDRPHVEVAR